MERIFTDQMLAQEIFDSVMSMVKIMRERQSGSHLIKVAESTSNINTMNVDNILNVVAELFSEWDYKMLCLTDFQSDKVVLEFIIEYVG